MKHVQACLSAGEDRESSFHYCGSLFMCEKDLITTLKACLSCREDPESSFHNCEGPVRLVQTCLCAGNTFVTFEEELSSACRPVKVRGKIVKAVFTTVEVL